MLINTGKGINRGRCLSKSIGAAVERRGEGEGQWREAIGVGIKGFGAGRFAFSIWRMLPPPSRISGPCKPREKPLLPAWYRLIYSRKVAIVDIKPATPTFIPVDTRYACVCVCVARWVVSVNALYTSFNIRYFNPPLISHESYIGRNGYQVWIICSYRITVGRKNWKFLWKEVDRFERLAEKASPLLGGREWKDGR